MDRALDPIVTLSVAVEEPVFVQLLLWAPQAQTGVMSPRAGLFPYLTPPALALHCSRGEWLCTALAAWGFPCPCRVLMLSQRQGPIPPSLVLHPGGACHLSHLVAASCIQHPPNNPVAHMLNMSFQDGADVIFPAHQCHPDGISSKEMKPEVALVTCVPPITGRSLRGADRSAL